MKLIIALTILLAGIAAAAYWWFYGVADDAERIDHARSITFYMLNGDVLQGHLDLDPLSTETVYGLITFPQDQITTITNLAGQQNTETILTVGGDRFSGVLNTGELPVTIANGDKININKDMIERIELYPAETTVSPDVSDVVAMRNGDIFQVAVTDDGYLIETSYGSMNLKKSTLERIEFTGKDDGIIAKVRLNNQSGVVNGLFKTAQIHVQTRAGQDLILTPAQLQRLAINATPAEVMSDSAGDAAADSAKAMRPAGYPRGNYVSDGFLLRDSLDDGSEGPEMVLIPAGTFQTGSAAEDSGNNPGKTLHTVIIDRPFAVGRYEVTFAEYDRFADETDTEKPYDQDWGRGNRPVINISWFDAVAYTGWLSEKTGKSYRLLTEAEWEYAARAGSETVYWWGDHFVENMIVCKECNNQWQKREAAPVGLLAANGFGLYDMLGNVWEWTCSVYQEHAAGPELRCAETDNEELRTIRGGSYVNTPASTSTTVRDTFSPADNNEVVGFRLARDL